FVSGRIYDDPRVTLYVGDGRSVLARSEDRYDLVQMSMIDTWAASVSGAMVLTENTLYTREAFRAYVDHLTDRGLLSVSRWYYPSRGGETARVLRLVGDALQARGVAHPEDHVACVVSRGLLGAEVSTTIARLRPLDAEDAARLSRLRDGMGFEVLWPAVDGTSPARFDPAAAIRGDKAFLASAPYDLAVPTHDRAFFFNMR